VFTSSGITHVCCCRLVSRESWNFRIIYYSLAALHVSSDIFAHHQEHLNCIYSCWYYTRMLLPVGIMGELELQDYLLFLGCSTCFERYFRSSSGAFKLYLQLLVLHTYVAAGWYHGRVGTSVPMSENIARNM